jgi:hypothetical protein
VLLILCIIFMPRGILGALEQIKFGTRRKAPAKLPA